MSLQKIDAVADQAGIRVTGGLAPGAGLVVAIAIPLVLAITFVVMASNPSEYW